MSAKRKRTISQKKDTFFEINLKANLLQIFDESCVLLFLILSLRKTKRIKSKLCIRF